MKKILLLSLIFIFSAQSALAAPAVSNVSGSINHGQNITISGSGFGVKVPAAPVFWDNGEHSSDIATKYCNGISGCVHPQAPWNLQGAAATYNTQYRTGSFRGMGNSNSRGNRFIAGTHYDNRPTDNYIYDAARGANVGVTIAYNQVIRKAYLSYYWALAPDWPQDAWKGTVNDKTWACENFKERVWEGIDGFGPYDGSGWPYYGFGGCTTANATSNGTPSHSQYAYLNLNNNTGGTGIQCRTAGTSVTGNQDFCLEKSGLIGSWAKLEDIQDQSSGIETMSVNILTGAETYEHSKAMEYSFSNIHTHYGDRYNITLGGYYCKQTQSYGLASWSGPDGNGEWSADLAVDQFLLVRESGATDAWFEKGSVGSLSAGQWGWANGRAFLGEDPAEYVFYASNSQCAARFSGEGSGPGGYYAHAAVAGAAPTRYYDDVYFDNTWSRVVLANNSNINQATIIEPQIPQAWSDGSVTVQINGGKIADGQQAYLFVFDANNERNPTGYPVTLSGSGDTTAPSAPTGLSVL